MPKEKFQKLTELLDDVVSGRFRESMRLKSDGSGWSNWEFWNDDGPRSGGSLESREKAARILDGKAQVVVEWMPWQQIMAEGAAN